MWLVDPAGPTDLSEDKCRNLSDTSASYSAVVPVTRRQFLAGSATAATAAVASGRPVRAAAASTNPADLTVLQALEAMKARTLAPSELLQACLARIDALDPTLMAFLHRTDEVATAAAKASDARYAAGTALLLDGLPYAAKDIFYTQGIPTTCASAAWGSYLADEDATLVARLAAAGAGLTGKVNTHEFAFGASTPPTRNSWDTSLIPGGSSGGSGSIVGAHALPMATGSDTIGSLRIPASVNGIVGIRPTFGLSSRHGVVPLAFSFDTTGLLSRTVADAAFLLSFVVGPDPGDPTTATAVTTTYPTSAPADLKGVRLGMPTSWFFDGASAAISSSVRAAVAHAQARGAVMVDVDLPAVFTEVMAPQPGADTLVGTDGLSAVLGDALSVPTIVCYTEAAGYHYRLRREAMTGYSQDINELLTITEQIPASSYLRAQQLRAVFVAAMRDTFTSNGIDALVAPTCKNTPPAQQAKGGANQSGLLNGSANAHNNTPWSFCGFPSMSMPVGLDDAGVPVGLQLNGLPRTEATLLSIALAIEEAVDFAQHRPAVLAGH